MQTMGNCIAFQLPRAQRITNTSQFSNAKSGLNLLMITPRCRCLPEVPPSSRLFQIVFPD